MKQSPSYLYFEMGLVKQNDIISSCPVYGSEILYKTAETMHINFMVYNNVL